jgi:hypothetical protein
MTHSIQSAQLDKVSRLIGQHPAALRSVTWHPQPPMRDLHNLELETKHGHVIVFDHHQPIIHSLPPRPDQVHHHRQWQDLTEQAPDAFNGRPTIAAIDTQDNPQGWVIRFSTGTSLTYLLSATSPLLLAN